MDEKNGVENNVQSNNIEVEKTNQTVDPSLRVDATASISPQIVNTEGVVNNQSINNNVELVGENTQIPPTSNESNIPPEKKGGKFKRFMMYFMFILLFLFVWFLPEISSYIKSINNKPIAEEEIVTGTLTCKLSRTTDTLNINLKTIFTFENKKIKTLSFTTESIGQAGKDEVEIANLKEECNTLKTYTSKIDGVNIICNAASVTNAMTQYFDYELLDTASVTSAYTEAGGTYPEFSKDEDIDNVEERMELSNYTCERTTR